MEFKLLVPTYLDPIFRRLKKVERSLSENYGSGEDIRIEKGKLKFAYIGIYRVAEGAVKLFKGGKFIKLCFENELIYFDGVDPTLEYFSDFDVKINIIEGDDIEFYRLSSEYFSLINSIHLTLLSQNVPERADTYFRYNTYQDGDEIIPEGSEVDYIFELVEGECGVYIGEKKVGKIEEGEIFGELSFFLNSNSTASVKADGKVIVRYIKRDDFDDSIRTNPVLYRKIAETLAARVVDLNSKVK